MFKGSSFLYLAPLGLFMACPKPPPLPPENCVVDGLCYQAQLEFAVGADPLSIDLGDVDGDGDLDAVSLNADTLSVLENENGTLQTARNVGVGVQLRSAALGDMDGDQDLDVVAGGLNGLNAAQVLIFGNDGQGNYAPSGAVSATQRTPLTIALGDLDEDGDLDVIDTAFGRELEMFSNVNGGQLSAPVLLNADIGNFVVVVDLDDDNDNDLAISNSITGDVIILKNQGGGTAIFDAPQTVASVESPRAVLPGDVTGDGRPDLIIPDLFAEEIGVLINQGGQFAAIQIVATGVPMVNLALGDLDQNGDLDIVAANGFSGSASVVYNEGQGNFASPVVFAVSGDPLSVVLGDITGDALFELVFACVTTDTLSILPASLEP